MRGREGERRGGGGRGRGGGRREGVNLGTQGETLKLPILLSVLSAIRNKFQFLISRQGDFAQCLIQYEFHKSVTFLLVIHDLIT